MKTKKKIQIDEEDIEMEILEDDSPDISYLEQEGFEDRLREFKEGLFNLVGVRATVEIEIPYEGNFFVQTVTSPGLWGVEDDDAG